MMFLTYTDKFTYTHKLCGDGIEDTKCLKMHAHNSKVVFAIEVKSNEFIDFKELKGIINPILSEFGRHTANDILGTGNATAEKIVGYLQTLLRFRLIENGIPNNRTINIELRETKKYGVVLTDD